MNTIATASGNVTVDKFGTVQLENVASLRGWLGEVRKTDSKWQAVPAFQVAWAHPTGPTFRTRREAAAHLGSGATY